LNVKVQANKGIAGLNKKIKISFKHERRIYSYSRNSNEPNTRTLLLSVVKS
jgi:hypothetical protein